VCDVYDAERLREAVAAFAPEVVVNELTDMPEDPAQIGPGVNARIRTEGHRNLLAAAGGAKVLAQSIAFPVSGEAAAAVEELERTTLAADGVVLRYGTFYGPGTYSERSGRIPEPPRVHVETAARRTVEALDAQSGVLEIVD
jgi:hypothetical protein